jgi:3-hydroxypropanoate dehydrogenase
MNLTPEKLFTEARTAIGFSPEPVPDETLRAIYDLMKWGPTSANCTPARIAFVRTPEAKARLIPCMNAGSNQRKVQEAPVTAIIGMDMAFDEQLPRLFPHTDARSWYAGNDEKIAFEALRGSSLQGGYFIVAARALGLDCGPMGGFDAVRVDAEFWAGTSVKTNFVCTLGHGDASRLRPRNPRLSFEEACKLV